MDQTLERCNRQTRQKGTDKAIDRKTERQTDNTDSTYKTDRTDRTDRTHKTYRTNRQTDTEDMHRHSRQTDTHDKQDRQTDNTGRQTDKQTDKQTSKRTENEREQDRKRKRERERETERKRKTDKWRGSTGSGCPTESRKGLGLAREGTRYFLEVHVDWKRHTHTTWQLLATTSESKSAQSFAHKPHAPPKCTTFSVSLRMSASSEYSALYCEIQTGHCPLELPHSLLHR